MNTNQNNISELNGRSRQWLFWSCFAALTATSFAFMVRAMLISEWGDRFNLTRTQMGEIIGVGLWPYAISIVLFGLIIDRIGYGRAMFVAFGLHIVSTVILILADGYLMLYAGTFILALGSGTVEATINPLVATMFPKEKSKWLNILHAGWPGGMVIGGILGMSLGVHTSWQYKVALTLIPILIYGILMLKRRFPTHERVMAGISYRDMLREVGVIGALIVTTLIVFEIGNLFNFSLALNLILIGILVGGYGLYVRSPGQPLFIFLLLIMFPLATTELGTDSWIVDLMTDEMHDLGLQAGWILVYMAIIMVIFRFLAGPLIRFFSPVGLLMLCSAAAALALYTLSFAAGVWVFVMATIYSFGKSYFYPTMIGIAGERFPKGGALTINVIIGVGLLGVGIVGSVFLGHIQDKEINHKIFQYDEVNNTTLYSEYITMEKRSIFGTYKALDNAKLENAPREVGRIISETESEAKKDVLKTVAILPVIMLICYVALFLYFKSRGGYKPVELIGESAPLRKTEQ